MIASLLALGAGIGLGGSDYLGGRISRSTPLATVLLGTQLTGLVLLVLLVAVLRPASLSWPLLAAGVGAGVCEIAGTAAIYRGLAVGITGIVAPIASTAPLVPLAAGAVLGTLPGPLKLVGVVLVLVGVVLASVERGGRGDRATSVRYGAASALAFGGYLVLIGIAASGDAISALLAARAGATAVLLLGLLVLRARRSGVLLRRPGRQAVLGAAAVGAIVTVADTAYAFSTRSGDLGLVAVLSSVHPVITLLLARLLDDERIGPLRATGVVAAFAGVVVITAL